MFRADADGKTLTFDLAGMNLANFVMRDRQTGSRWQQANGEAISGPLQGRRLAMVPFLLTTWGEWRAQHPQTLVLVPEPQFHAQYERMSQMVNRPQWGWRGASRGMERDVSTLPRREPIVGLEAGGAHKAYPLAVLQQQLVVNDQLGSTPVLLVHLPDTDTTTAFSRNVAGRVLTFKAADSKARELTDAETDSKWTPYGECIGGRLKGTQLNTLIPLPSFWFSWAEFFPDTTVYSAAR